MNTQSYKAGLLLASLLSLSLVAQGAETGSSAEQKITLKANNSHPENVESDQPCCCETWAVVGGGTESATGLETGKSLRSKDNVTWVSQNVGGNGPGTSTVRPQPNLGQYQLASLGSGTDSRSVGTLKGQAAVLRDGTSWDVVGGSRPGESSTRTDQILKGSSSATPWLVNGSGSSISSVKLASLKGTALTGTPDVSWRIPTTGAALQAGKVVNPEKPVTGSGWQVVGSSDQKSGGGVLPLRPEVLNPTYRLAVVGSSTETGSAGGAALKGRLVKDCE